MKRVMVVGSTGAGKTTLLKALELSPGAVKKTASISYNSFSIDVPGEFLDIPRFYHTLISSSVKAALVLIVIDASNPKPFPSKISKAFRAPCIGVINKIDLLGNNGAKKIRVAKSFLEEAGVKEFYEVSALSGKGIDELKRAIENFL
ncbi:MAG: ethanolamine utilization protein [Synergistetes bacterium]|nr:MAG: Miro domain protein [bacterium 42_11]MBC7332629.1 ethanolamine utilization protein [Synergistota bacterium]MDK2870680.1 ethanolamine utilization protein EutP [bacterium]